MLRSTPTLLTLLTAAWTFAATSGLLPAMSASTQRVKRFLQPALTERELKALPKALSAWEKSQGSSNHAEAVADYKALQACIDDENADIKSDEYQHLITRARTFLLADVGSAYPASYKLSNYAFVAAQYQSTYGFHRLNLKEQEMMTPMLQLELESVDVDDEGPGGLCDRISSRVTDVPFLNRILAAMAVDVVAHGDVQAVRGVIIPPKPLMDLCNGCETYHPQGVGLKRCAGCKVAFYCSQECQVKDWKKTHKSDCKRSQLGLSKYIDRAEAKAKARSATV